MLEIKNLSISFKENKILKNVNFKVDNGEMIAILGKSGTGKTTLFKAICLAFKNWNSIVYNNKEIKNKKDLKWYRKNIGLINQKNDLITNISLYENLKLEMSEKNKWLWKFFNLINKKQQQEIYKITKKLGIENKIFDLVSELSGGEAQRAQIAKLLIRNPKIILADEPTSNLDKKNSMIIIDSLKELAISNGSIVLINLHDTTLVNNKFNKVIGLKNQEIVFEKKPDDLNENIIEKLYE